MEEYENRLAQEDKLRKRDAIICECEICRERGLKFCLNEPVRHPRVFTKEMLKESDKFFLTPMWN